MWKSINDYKLKHTIPKVINYDKEVKRNPTKFNKDYSCNINTFGMQDKQRGFIGINLFAFWLSPQTKTIEDELATQRGFDFYFGW